MSQRYPMPLPFGWFQVSYSDELAVGQAKPIHYFGRDMVLFRTESGVAKVLDAYCPHMGAHLGYGIHEFMGKGGEVKGETIVCPFHGWRFNGDGVCEEVPYAKNMPPRVTGKQAIETWPIVEKNGSVYVWYHPENAAPLWDVIDVPEATSDEWGGEQRYVFTIKTHAQEMAENAADPAHFLYVHGTAEMPNTAEIVFNGHMRSTLIRSAMDTPRGQIQGEIRADSWGPGQSINRFSGICETVLMAHTVMVDEDVVEQHFSFFKKKVNGEVPKGGVADAIIADICKQIREDAPIWENKMYRPQPILCDSDGPIAKFRKWYQQFYVNYEESKRDERFERLGL